MSAQATFIGRNIIHICMLKQRIYTQVLNSPRIRKIDNAKALMGRTCLYAPIPDVYFERRLNVSDLRAVRALREDNGGQKLLGGGQ